MRCMSPLMDTEDKLPDTAFTASSVYRNTEGFQPHHARLVHVYDGKEHVSGHAWCPSNTVQTSMKEWIQVEFPTLVIIGIIFTAGRGDGNAYPPPWRLFASNGVNHTIMSGCRPGVSLMVLSSEEMEDASIAKAYFCRATDLICCSHCFAIGFLPHGSP
ncbi:unnamed protein product [Dibothriocephalus latus]|uniref:F5/8 type C domain-containing protein n=1 Tax=Dibothriocephalus latus TaxID=60516 RepID=A0A3P7M0Q9_DIBLA|nr:unnamed protein product [Dibothriocephalus latus]